MMLPRLHLYSHARGGGAAAPGLWRQPSQAAQAPPPAPTVSIVSVSPETVPVSSEWVATLDGFVNAQIRPQVTGYLIATHYREGSMVRKGQVLFEIDARPFEAIAAQADRADRTGAGRARPHRTRRRPRHAAREGARDPAESARQRHPGEPRRAGRGQVRGSNLATAKLNVGFTKVRSLIDGVAAIATAQIGDLVSPQTLLTTVSQVDPIRAFFSLSEQEYLVVADQINQPGARSRCGRRTPSSG